MNFEGGRMLQDSTFLAHDESDAHLLVRFFMYPILDEKRSSEEGMPKYTEIEMVEILAAGNKDKPVFKVTDHYRKRFAEKYARFKEKLGEGVSGTPLNNFPFISASEIKELEYFNVYTAEQLVGISDGNIERIGVNGRDLIKKVKAYMDAAKDSSVVTRFASENESLKREIELLKTQMSQILANKVEVNSDERRNDRKNRKSQ
jgi:hypothetical protein